MQQVGLIVPPVSFPLDSPWWTMCKLTLFIVMSNQPLSKHEHNAVAPALSTLCGGLIGHFYARVHTAVAYWSSANGQWSEEGSNFRWIVMRGRYYCENARVMCGPSPTYGQMRGWRCGNGNRVRIGEKWWHSFVKRHKFCYCHRFYTLPRGAGGLRSGRGWRRGRGIIFHVGYAIIIIAAN